MQFRRLFFASLLPNLRKIGVWEVTNALDMVNIAEYMEVKHDAVKKIF